MAFYDYIIFENSKVKCNLCLLTIEDDDILVENHVNGKYHKDLEIKRMLMQHSIVNMMNDADFYCYLCGLNIGKNVLEHLKKPEHNKILQEVRQLVKKDGAFIEFPELPNNAEVYCSLCNHKIEYKKSMLFAHIQCTKHRRARAVALQIFNGIFSVEGDNEHLWCKFCQKYIENYIEVIFRHMDSGEHVTNVAKIFNLIEDQPINIEKYLLDPKEDRARCEKCDTYVACNVINLESHIKGKQHKK